MTIENLELSSRSEHERELTITVASKFVGQEFKNTVTKIQRVAQRPGFRPGKMPVNMVMNLFGSKIKQDLIESLIEKSFDSACREKELVRVNQPQFEPVSDVAQDKPFTYRAIFQVKPKIAVPDYKGLQLAYTKFVFDEKDVDDELNGMRDYMATFIEPKDRIEITENDLVQCDSVVKIDDVINPAYSHKDYAVPMFAENVPADLKAGLLGKKIGDVASVKYTMPEDHQDEVIRGKECEMMLTITSFKERVLPTLDDDFAKDVSDKFTSIDDMKESIRLRFNITARRRDEYYRQDAITKALVEKNPIDVPPALVEVMALSLIERELKTVDEKVAHEMVKNHWQELRASMEERAKFRCKAELLFEALIDALDVKADDDEIAARVKRTKDLKKEDARYSIQVDKLLSIIEKDASITTTEEPLFQKGN